MPITMSRQQLSDLYRQSRGFGENALSMLTGGIGEPVAGFASLAALARGENAAGVRDAVRDAFTYQPRTAEGQGQQRMLGELAQSAMNSAPVRTWQRGVDFAGRASPVAGATLQSVPTAIGALAGYKQAMQTGNALSQRLAQAQRAAMENAMMPKVLHPQRGAVTAFSVDDLESSPGSYHRFTQTKDSPVTYANYAMFADDPSGVSSGYGKHYWSVDEKSLGGKIADASSDDFREMLKEYLDDNEHYLDRLGYGDKDELLNLSNPDDIVNSAGFWDAPDIAKDFIDEARAKGYSAIKTRDGLILIDDTAAIYKGSKK